MALCGPVGSTPITTPASRARGRESMASGAWAMPVPLTMIAASSHPPRHFAIACSRDLPEVIVAQSLDALRPANSAGFDRCRAHPVPKSRTPARGRRSATTSGTRPSVLEVLAQAFERLQLRGHFGQLLLRLGHVDRLATAG